MTSACGCGALAPVEIDAVEQRHAEAEGLAGAGAGLPDQVAAGERDRQRELLDREGLDDADGRRGRSTISGRMSKSANAGLSSRTAARAVQGGDRYVGQCPSTASASVPGAVLDVKVESPHRRDCEAVKSRRGATQERACSNLDRLRSAPILAVGSATVRQCLRCRVPLARIRSRTQPRARPRIPPSIRRSSTCWARWPTASCRPSTGSVPTPGWLRRWTDGSRCRSRRCSNSATTRPSPSGSASSASIRRRRWRPSSRPWTASTTLTGPSNWLEGLVKAYVGDGLAADFYREVAEFVDPATRELISEVLADTGGAEFAVREVRAAIADEPGLARPAGAVGTAAGRARR